MQPRTRKHGCFTRIGHFCIRRACSLYRFDQRVVRFCFAKKDETLRAALERLRKL